MKTRIAFLVVAALLAALLLPNSVHAQSNAVALTLERSTDGLSNWQTVQVTTNTVPASVNAFYRMRIATLPPATDNMITVQGGTLPQSSQLAGTVVATFRIGKYEVTWDEWQEVRAWGASNGYTDITNVGIGTAQQHPARAVSWYDAVKWCNAKSEKEGLTPVYRASGAIYRTGNFGWNGSGAVTANKGANGYRLPLEAEWEWAARGGASSQGYAHSGSDDANAVAWHFGNSTGGVLDLGNGRCDRVVGAKAPNELGIHDMSGNVWEWCEGFAPGPNNNNRRLRGISFSNMADQSTVQGFGSISEASPDSRVGAFGFRLARNAQ